MSKIIQGSLLFLLTIGSLQVAEARVVNKGNDVVSKEYCEKQKASMRRIFKEFALVFTTYTEEQIDRALEKEDVIALPSYMELYNKCLAAIEAKMTQKDFEKKLMDEIMKSNSSDSDKK
jgi:hypothetical protein